MDTMFFESWMGMARILIVGTLAYVALLLCLRVSGKRTLSKMNAFDFVVTVALGSTLATVLLGKGVALADGITAFVLLVGLQFVVTWTSVRVAWVRKLVTGESSALVEKGTMLPDAMRRERVTTDEIEAAVRAAGFGDVASVDTVVLETDGSFSVIQRVARAGR